MSGTAPSRIALASAVGTSHLGSGAPCQDSAAGKILATPERPVLIAVVCDGAGSAAYSDVGSMLAVNTFIECVGLHFDEGGRIADLSQGMACQWVDQTAEALATCA